MVLCEMLSRPLQEMQDFMYRENIPMSFCTLPYNFHVIELTLCYQLMVFACEQTLSSSTPLQLIWFYGLIFLARLLRLLQLKHKTLFVMIDS